MSDPEVVGRLIDDHRRRAGLTKTALAAAAGIPLSFLIKAVEGRTTLTMERIALVSAALHLNGADSDKLRHANLRARANREGLELARRASPDPASAAHHPDGAIPVRYVPVLARVPAGNPKDYTDGDYPAGCAEEFVGVPAPFVQKDPSAFALRIEGDSMLPRFHDGDIVVVAPQSLPRSGRPAVVKVDGAVTCKLWSRHGNEVTLTPLNSDYAERKYTLSHIEWAYPITLLISAV